MISLKKHMEMLSEELLHSSLDSYRAALADMGDCGLRACPHLGQTLQASLINLSERLSGSPTPALLEETGQRVHQELDLFGKQTAEYLKQKAAEAREIMMIMASTSEALGEKDQRYAGRFHELTAKLQTIAGLEDLTQIRASVASSAQEMKSCVEAMAREGQESVAHLRAELAGYQARLEVVERLALLDVLTGLDSRRRAEQELERRVSQTRPFCVMVLDLNGFKPVNDRFGHLAGDDLLQQFATELRSGFGPVDVVGRWGGDEFIVLFEGSLQDAASKVETMREWVFGEYTIRVNGKPHRVKITAAVGVAAWNPGETVAQLLGRADAAMYKDKPS